MNIENLFSGKQKEISIIFENKNADEIIEVLKNNQELTLIFLKNLKNHPDWIKENKEFIDKIFTIINSNDSFSSVFKLARKTNVFRKILESHLQTDQEFIARYHRYLEQNSPKEPISTKTCANLLCDAFIREMVDDNGDKLEGLPFLDAIQFFQALLEEVSPQMEDPVVRTQSSAILTTMTFTEEVCKELDNMTSRGASTSAPSHSDDNLKLRDLEEPLYELVLKIQTQFQSLKPGDSLLLPFGYQNYPGGHALLCEFIRTSDTHFDCLIINTGDGTEYHYFKQFPNKIRISPVQRYSNLTLDEISDTTFLSTFFETMIVRFINKNVNPYSAKDCYFAIFQRFNDKLNPTPPIEIQEFMTQQRSGSCSIRVLMAYLRHKIGKQAYKKLKFRMNREVLRKLLSDPQKLNEDKTRRAILKNGLETFCRSALKLYPELVADNGPSSSASSLLSIASSSATVERYSELRETLSLIEKVEDYLQFATPKPEQAALISTIPTPLHNRTTQLGELISALKGQEKVFPSSSPSEDFSNELTSFDEMSVKKPPLLPTNYDPQTLTDHLKELVDYMIYLKSHAYSDPNLQLNHIDTAILQLPMPNNPRDRDSVWNDLNAQECIHAIKQLTLFIANARMKNDFFTENLITMEKLLALAHYQACRLDSERNLEGVERPYRLDSFKVQRNNLIALQNSVFSSHHYPHLDSTIRCLMNYYSPSYLPEAAPTLFNYSSSDFYFYLNSGERCYLEQFQSKIPHETLSQMEIFCSELSAWRYVRDEISPVVQILWAGEVSDYPEEINHILDLVPSYFRQIIDISIVIGYKGSGIHLIDYSSTTLVKLQFKNDYQKTQYSFSGTDKRIEYSPIDITEHRVLSNVEDHSMRTLLKYLDVIYEPDMFSPKNYNKLYSSLIHNNENEFLLINRQRDISDYIIFKKIRGARVKNFLEGSILDLHNIEDQNMNELISSSFEMIAREITAEPEFARQILRVIAIQSTKIELYIQEKEKENTEGSLNEFRKLFHTYTYLKQLKINILDRIRESNHQSLESLSQEEINNEIIETRSEYYRVIKSLKWKSNIDKKIALMHYNSMFLFPPSPTDKELFNMFLNFSTGIQRTTLETLLRADYPKDNLTYINFRFEDAHRAHSIQLDRFCQMLEIQELRNQFISSFMRRKYALHLPSQPNWEGRYPHFSVKERDDVYTLDMTSWILKKNGHPIITDEFIEVVYTHRDYIFVFQNQRIKSLQLEVRQTSNYSGAISITTEDLDSSNVRFLIINNTFQIEKYFDGIRYVFEPECPIPLPLEKQPNSTSYEVWRAVEGECNILIVDRENKQPVCIIREDGRVVLDPKDPSRIYHSVALQDNPSTLPLLKFDFEDHILAVESLSDGNEHYFGIHYQRYRTLNGEPISFTQKRITVKNKNNEESQEVVLQWNNNPSYYIDPNQTINGLEGITRYLVLRNVAGRRMLLIPLLTNTHHLSRRYGENEIPLTINLISIDLDEKGRLTPQSTHQRAYAFYLHLTCRDYESAFRLIKKLEQPTRYSNEVLALLGWIINSEQENRDYHPNAIALRSYVGWMVKDNLFRNQTESMPTEEQKGNMDTLYAPPEQWGKYWDDRSTLFGKEVLTTLSETYISYLNLRKAVDHRIRFDVSRKGLKRSPLSPFEEIQFLNALIKHSAHPQLLARLDVITSGIKSSTGPFIKQRAFQKWTISSLVRSDLSINTSTINTSVYYLRNMFPRTRPQISNFNTYSGTSIENQSTLQKLMPLAFHSAESRKELREALQYMSFSTNANNLVSILGCLAKEGEWGDKLRKAVSDFVEKKEQKKQSRSRSSYFHDDSFYDLLDNMKKLIIRMGDDSPITEISHPTISTPLTLNPSGIGFSAPPTQQNLFFIPLNLEVSTTAESSSSEQEYPQPLLYEKIPVSMNRHVEMPPLPTNDPSAIQKYQEYLADFDIGKSQYEASFEYVFSNSNSLKTFRNDTKLKSKELRNKNKKIKNTIKTLGNKLPENENALYKRKLELSGKTRPFRTLEDFIGAFLQGSSEVYHGLNNALSEEEITQLHQLVGEYLQTSIELNRLKGILNASKTCDWQQLGELIEQRTAYDAEQYPAFLVFEHYIGFKLRPDQIADIKKMLPVKGVFSECMIQKIMGAGKTLVLGTLLAFLKADGHHLSVIIPPASLYNVNIQEMKNRAEAMFGQRVRSITLSRNDKHLNPIYLRYIYDTLTKAIENREVIIAPPDVFHTIRNQYHALHYELSIHPEKKSELTDTITELKAILKLIHDKAIFTFDEVDSVLDPTKDYNFSVGNSKPIPKDEIDLIKELYKVATLVLQIPFYENRQAEIPQKQHLENRTLFAATMIDRLLNSPQWMHKLKINESHREALQEFFSNPDAPLPEFISQHYTSGFTHASDLLVVIREEICTWIPESCKASAHSNYDFSKGKYHAVPCSANNKPSKKSDFSHRIEMMNRTYQLYVHKGLNYEQTKKFLTAQKTNLHREFETNQSKTKLSQLPTAIRFRNAFGGNLVSLNVEDEKVVALIQDKLRLQDPLMVDFLLDFVAEEVLSEIKIFNEQIQSNAHNLYKMPKGRNGYSGTIEEIKDLYPIPFIPETGTNGRILLTTLTQNSVVHVSSAKSVTDVLEDVLSEEKVAQDPTILRFRALIDTGPRFKGVNSHQAALEIFHFMRKHPDRGVKGVLYWDDESELLCCIKAGRETIPIALESSDLDSICGMTELHPDEWFVFFPHHKLTGANIPLPVDAKALATFSESTPWRDLAQGDFRMRQLHKGQRVERLITPELIPLIWERLGTLEDPLTVRSLIPFAFLNGFDKEKNNLLLSALQELYATAQEEIEKQMIAAETLEEEHALFVKSQNLFIKNIHISFYQQYGQNIKTESVDQFLENKLQEVFTLATGKSKNQFLEGYEVVLAEKLQEIKNRIIEKNYLLTVNLAQLEGASCKTAEQQQETTQESKNVSQSLAEIQITGQFSDSDTRGHPMTLWGEPVLNFASYEPKKRAEIESYSSPASSSGHSNVEFDLHELSAFLKVKKGKSYADRFFLALASDNHFSPSDFLSVLSKIPPMSRGEMQRILSQIGMSNKDIKIILFNENTKSHPIEDALLDPNTVIQTLHQMGVEPAKWRAILDRLINWSSFSPHEIRVFLESYLMNIGYSIEEFMAIITPQKTSIESDYDESASNYDGDSIITPFELLIALNQDINHLRLDSFVNLLEQIYAHTVPDAIQGNRLSAPTQSQRVVSAPKILKLNGISDIPECDFFTKNMPEELYATENYLRTVEDEINLFGNNAKPIHEVLAIYNPNATGEENPWKIILMSTLDSEYFKENLPKHIPEMEHLLLIQPNMDIVQQGEMKFRTLPSIHQQSLREMMVPVLFLNGDVETLSSWSWIESFTAWAAVNQGEKRELFESQILRKPYLIMTKDRYFGSSMQKALYP